MLLQATTWALLLISTTLRVVVVCTTCLGFVAEDRKIVAGVSAPEPYNSLIWPTLPVSHD